MSNDSTSPVRSPSGQGEPAPPTCQAAAIELLTTGFWPVAIYPPGIDRKGKTTTKGKEPIGGAWGLAKITSRQISARFGRYPDVRVGVALGPGRGPKGEDIADFEGDGLRAEESYLELCGGEITATMSWTSRRSPHHVHSIDHPRLASLLTRCNAKEGDGEKKGVFYLPEHFPDLEIRMGGPKKDGVLKQVQSVVPPSPGDDGKARQWIHGPDALEPLPEIAYQILEDIAERIEERAAIQAESQTISRPRARVDSASRPFPAADSPQAAWFRDALDAEADEVAHTPEGKRRNRLRDAAYNLGGQIHHGYLSESQIVQALTSAGQFSGLPADEVEETIRNAVRDGQAHPLPWPDKLDQPNGQYRSAVARRSAPAKRLVVRADQVDEKDITWLCQDIIPCGFLTIFYGRTSVGKTFIALDFVARYTTDAPWPNKSDKPAPGCVVIFSEDPHASMLRPRLRALGADLTKVFFVTWDAMKAYELTDTEMLDAIIGETGVQPGLVLIDPPTNFLGQVDENSNAQVRKALMHLVEWVDKRENPTAVIMITQVNKGGRDLDALERAIGSIAWVSTHRIAHCLAPDPKVKSGGFFSCAKSNLGPIPATMKFVIVPEGKQAKVVWDGESNQTADEVMAAPAKQSADDKAAEWLTARFREKSTWLSDDLKARASADGISLKRLFNSPEDSKVRNLPIKKRQEWDDANYDRCWVWEAIPPWPAP
jgi:hypothetical protein